LIGRGTTVDAIPASLAHRRAGRGAHVLPVLVPATTHPEARLDTMGAMSQVRGPAAVDVALEVNGRQASVRISAQRSLLDTLRESLALTGTKKVCNEGDCGACTVLVDGRPVYSCITLAIACEGKRIETIEGLARDGELDPVQQAFIDHDAYQCGFCTPGQIMSVVALLRGQSKVTADDVARAVSGNLCRCGAYTNIVAAGLTASRTWGGRAEAPAKNGVKRMGTKRT
jgi:xanthine dehydrogenase YagT iron-sulfur-binding subunit